MSLSGHANAFGYPSQKERESFHCLNVMSTLPTGSTSVLELVATDKLDSTLAPRLRVKGKTAAVTLTSTPTIKVPPAATEIVIEGADDVKTVTLKSESTLPGSGLLLSGGADVTLGAGDVLVLYYSFQLAKWLAKGPASINS